jgi:hypothetical protein
VTTDELSEGNRRSISSIEQSSIERQPDEEEEEGFTGIEVEAV